MAYDSPEKQRAWYEANRERVAVQQRARRQGPERGAILARERERRQKKAAARPPRPRLSEAELRRRHAARERERRTRIRADAEAAARFSAANRANVRRWAKENPDRARELGRRTSNTRRAREAQVFVEQVDALVVLERDDGMCGICGEDVDPLDFHLDHVFPLAKGGLHSYANVQVAHPSCNRAKGARA